MKLILKKLTSKDFHRSFITLILAFTIILFGYYTLDVAGSHFIISNNDISKYSSHSDDSYVFYSQSDSEIVLFPWNYYKSSTPLLSMVLNFSYQADSSGYFYSNYYYSSDDLYQHIEYYFYQMAPNNLISYFSYNNLSLYDEMDFYSIDSNLNATIIDDTIYYFYKKELSFNGDNYLLSFSFDSTSYIYSFQLRPIYPETTITKDVMENGSEFLKDFLNKQISSSESSDDADNNSKNNSTIDVFDNDMYLRVEASENSSTFNNSYQIIETDGELLLVSITDSLVYYFDPVQNNFTGFNFID